MAGALDGIRVLDFGRYIAGPWCAALLGDLGAEVIRVDKRAGSEDRFVGPVADGGEGALYLQANRNKRGMTLDPMKPAGREVVRRLVAQADVVIANLPPQSLEAMGLDWPTVSALNPAVVLTTISAFGSGGPYERRLGFDGIGQAMSGSMYLSGHPGEPMKAYVPWVDFGTATNAALATVAALYARRATGRGQHVEASLLQTALTVSNSALVEQRVRKLDRVAIGEPQPDRRAERRLPHRRRLDPRAGDRPAALRALVQAGRRDGAARRSALRERPRARRQRRAALRADGPLVRGAQLGRGARARSRPRASRRARSTRRSRRSTIRTCARRRSCASARSRVCPSTRRSRTRRSASPRTRAGIRTRAPQLGEHTDEILRRARLLGRSDRRAAPRRGRLALAPFARTDLAPCSGRARHRRKNAMTDAAKYEELFKGLLPGTLGIRFLEVSKERVRASLAVEERLCTIPGVLHGGAIMAFADTLGAVATAQNLANGDSTTTIESKTNFLAAGRAGTEITGDCTPLHRGRRTMVWQTRVTGPDGKLLALVTQTQAVLERARAPAEIMAGALRGQVGARAGGAAGVARARRRRALPQPRRRDLRREDARRAARRGRARGRERGRAREAARQDASARRSAAAACFRSGR